MQRFLFLTLGFGIGALAALAMGTIGIVKAALLAVGLIALFAFALWLIRGRSLRL